MTAIDPEIDTDVCTRHRHVTTAATLPCEECADPQPPGYDAHGVPTDPTAGATR